jgi:hypothetical protein
MKLANYITQFQNILPVDVVCPENGLCKMPKGAKGKVVSREVSRGKYTIKWADGVVEELSFFGEICAALDVVER